MAKFYKNYTGYVREGLVFAASRLRRRAPSNKFVIFTIGRSGSGLLVSLLHSHAHIHCADELLAKPLFSPKGYIKNYETLAKKTIYGFKLNTYHFRVQKIQDPVGFVTDLHEDGYKIISLKRHNLINQVISHMYAVHRNIYHHQTTKGQQLQASMRVDLEFLKMELDKFTKFQEIEANILSQVPFLPISYEEDLSIAENHQLTVNKITDFLGIEASVVHTNFAKTTPKEWSRFIENEGEVKAYLLQAGYGEYLQI